MIPGAIVDRGDLNVIAKKIAKQLFDALLARQIDKVNIDTIRGALVIAAPIGLTEDRRTELEELTTRAVVEKA